MSLSTCSGALDTLTAILPVLAVVYREPMDQLFASRRNGIEPLLNELTESIASNLPSANAEILNYMKVRQQTFSSEKSLPKPISDRTYESLKKLLPASITSYQSLSKFVIPASITSLEPARPGIRDYLKWSLTGGG